LKKYRDRILGVLVCGPIGFFVGVGTGIVGGPFGAVAGVGIFTTIGVAYGWSAGPDVAGLIKRLRRPKE